MSTTLEPVISSTAESDPPSEAWQTVKLSSRSYRPPSPPAERLQAASHPRYRSMLTGPIAPGLGLAGCVVMAVAFTLQHAFAGTIVSIILCLMFAGLTALNAVTPDCRPEKRRTD